MFTKKFLDLLFRPSSIGGYEVDYSSPISEPCPHCGGRTYRSVKDRGIACCTRCEKLLYVYPDN